MDPARAYATCEWCGERATYRVSSGARYRRFACNDERHRALTWRLGIVDRGNEQRDLIVASCGFKHTRCDSCGQSRAFCVSQCVVCLAIDCGGIGRWACHATEDLTPVCCGPCFKTYEAQRKESETLRLWMDALVRWDAIRA